ncbi:MAG: multicopper oxidase domain-containing protein [Chloroflexota bacterium]
MSDTRNQQQDSTVASTNTNKTTKRGMNRRNFLKASAIGAGALVTLPTLGSEQVSSAPTSQESDYPQTGTAQSGNGQGRLLEKETNNPLNVSKQKLRFIAETWAEPSVWRPSDWPGQPLPLHVVENAAPLAVTGLGFNNAKPLLFSYNGSTPGPTIRMSGDETLFVHVRNLLGPDLGKTPVGAYPDPIEGYPEPEGSLFQAVQATNPSQTYGEGLGQMPTKPKEDWCLGEHVNGVHTNHVTNLHTHGLHVRPEANPDGTHSDNVILRIMPQADWKRREADLDASCRFIRENEVVGQAPYEFRLGNVQDDPNQPHPAGTFWYHPHAHGATHNQVAAGMAGFLIVEGDVDEALHTQLVLGKPLDGKSNTSVIEKNYQKNSVIEDSKLVNPVYQLPYDPARRTGPFDYRERLMFIQRVQVTAEDPDAPVENIGPRQKKAVFNTTNGGFEPRIITMRPGAIERWRILNGSVDGKSYMRFMVLKGRYEYKISPPNPLAPNPRQPLYRIEEDGTKVPIKTMAEIGELKHPLWLLAWDGITLVRETEPGEGKYYIQNLNFEAKTDPLIIDDCKNNFINVDDCYKDAESIRASYVRPNELDLAAANRADVLIQAPILGDNRDAEIYTVIGMGTPLHADGGPRPDTIIAYVIVSGNPVEGMRNCNGGDCLPLHELELPEVQSYLKPITNDELMVMSPEAIYEKLEVNGPPLSPQQEYVLANEIEQYNSTVKDTTYTKVTVDQTDPNDIKTKTVETVQKPKRVESRNFRTRKITYAGWGANDFPLVTNKDSDLDAYIAHYHQHQKLRYYQAPQSLTIAEVTLPQGVKEKLSLRDEEMTIPALPLDNLRQPDGSPLPPILLPPGTRTMSIDGRKFNPTDQVHPKMLWWTAEEWVLTNNSITLWRSEDDKPLFFTADKMPTREKVEEILTKLKCAIEIDPYDERLRAAQIQYQGLLPEEKKGCVTEETVVEEPCEPIKKKYKYDHPTYWGRFKGYPMTRREARDTFGGKHKVATNAADHPFHMHQNPFWVMRIDVPDENGNLVNILPHPRWQDTIWIPRNGGRVIFRSRFPDYLGVYVNHCHLLLHEDNGMMQAVEAVPTANSANYRPAENVLHSGIKDEDVDKLYPTDSKNLGRAWIDSMHFIDPDPNTGQMYPGFTVSPPTLPT